MISASRALAFFSNVVVIKKHNGSGRDGNSRVMATIVRRAQELRIGDSIILFAKGHLGMFINLRIFPQIL